MTFRIRGLDPAPFAALAERSDAELAALGVRRRVADSEPGFPCRVSLAYVPAGTTLLLLSYEHLPAQSPYRSSGAIYVRPGAKQFDAIDEIPDCVARATLLSLRAYDGDALMHECEVVKPAGVRDALARLLADERTAYVHVHNAAPGCFSCRVDRA